MKNSLKKCSLKSAGVDTLKNDVCDYYCILVDVSYVRHFPPKKFITAQLVTDI